MIVHYQLFGTCYPATIAMLDKQGDSSLIVHHAWPNREKDLDIRMKASYGIYHRDWHYLKDCPVIAQSKKIHLARFKDSKISL